MKIIQKGFTSIKSGFTLVELLIVISLLGVIAMIVIAAINPIEQANRARDTQFRSDGAQLISAIDRYFTAKSEYPWVTGQSQLTNDSAFGYLTASTQGVGICGTDCTVDGVLLSSNELKPEFKNRGFISATTPGKQLFVGKASASQSVYICYIPMAKSNRDTAVVNKKVFTIGTNGVRTQTTACDAAGSDWVANGCYVCLPD